MRIEGTHSSGIRVVIMEVTIKKFELYCYTIEGALVYEGTFTRALSAQKHVRKKYDVTGKWRWDVRIRLKGQ